MLDFLLPHQIDDVRGTGGLQERIADEGQKILQVGRGQAGEKGQPQHAVLEEEIGQAFLEVVVLVDDLTEIREGVFSDAEIEGPVLAQKTI